MKLSFFTALASSFRPFMKFEITWVNYYHNNIEKKKMKYNNLRI